MTSYVFRMRKDIVPQMYTCNLCPIRAVPKVLKRFFFILNPIEHKFIMLINVKMSKQIRFHD